MAGMYAYIIVAIGSYLVLVGVMNLKHILCQPMEEKSTMIQYQADGHHADYQQTMDQWQHARAISTNNRSASSLYGCHPYPRKRVQSAHYPISPIISRGSHYREDALIAPLISSMSTSMITTPCTSPDMNPPSPKFAVISSPTFVPMPPFPQQRCRRRSASTSHVNQQQKKSIHPNPSSSSPAVLQTRTPWTPTEDYLLQKGYDQGLSWAMISATHLPHRSRGCCWGRFKTLQSKNLVHVSIQQPSRLARRAWKAVDMKKTVNATTCLPSPLSPTSA